MSEGASPLYCLPTTRGLRGGLMFESSFESPSNLTASGADSKAGPWHYLHYSGLAASQPALPQAHGSQGFDLGQRAEKTIENALTGLQP
jgi:hypothetical protein